MTAIGDFMPEPTPDRYLSLTDAEWYVAVARGPMGFRFGPYTGAEAGKIMERATTEQVPVFLTATCGREFDWDLARDMRGWPAERFPMDEAPRDGSTIVVDWNGVECLAQWSREWGVFRYVDENGVLDKPIEPRSWRWPDVGDLAASKLDPRGAAGGTRIFSDDVDPADPSRGEPA